MRAIKKLSFILILAIITIILVGWDYFSTPKQFVSNQTFVKNSDPFFSYEVTKYPSNVEIIPPQYREQKMTIGIVTDPWNLNFGIIPAGSHGTRHITISNSEKNKVKVSFKVYGSIKPLISFNQNNFILLPNESVYIDVFLNTTDKTRSGNYTGEINVIIKKPNLNFLYWIL
jgi:hypothetical protein